MTQRIAAPPLDTHGRLGDLETYCAALGYWPLLGTDEVGRGPLAGPVVTAAVVLRDDAARGLWSGLEKLNDSKKLSEADREALVPVIEQAALAWHIEPAWEPEIAERNILHASLAAMRRACQHVMDQLTASGLAQPGAVLVDGNQPLADWPTPQLLAVQGDGRSRAIAAASVLAKVWRDRYMTELETRYPGYGFAKHKGYPTPPHLAALRQLGPCPAHRTGFGPVAQAARQQSLFDA